MKEVEELVNELNTDISIMNTTNDLGEMCEKIFSARENLEEIYQFNKRRLLTDMKGGDC